MWQWKLGGCEGVCVRGECCSGNWVDVRVCVGGVSVAVETGWM